MNAISLASVKKAVFRVFLASNRDDDRTDPRRIGGSRKNRLKRSSIRATYSIVMQNEAIIGSRSRRRDGRSSREFKAIKIPFS